MLSPPFAMAADTPAPAANAASGQPENNSLPDLAQPVSSQTHLRPSSSGFVIDSHDATSRFSANTETSHLTGTSIGVRGAVAIGAAAALGVGVQMGGNSGELFMNLGLSLGGAQRLMFTAGQLRQKLDFNFASGNSRAEMTQNSIGASWRFTLGSGLFDYAEANAYAARTASRDLEDLTYAVDTATLYELWNDPRRVAGGRMAGVQGRLGLKPWDSGRINLGFGQERLRYDLLGGAENHNRATGSFGLEQAIDGQTRLKFGADAAAAQTRYNLGFDHRFGTLGTLGVDLVNIRGRDNSPNDNRVQLSWTIPLGKATNGPSSASPVLAGRSESVRARAADARTLNPDSPAPSSGSDGLLDQVATRPAWMPSQVIAKLDITAGPTRLIAVDKAALPAGSSVNTATGAITTPIGVVVTGIASVTLNAAPFVNNGQFALSGNNLVIDPGKITQPAVGVVDIYVVTVNNFGGGTTLITVNVSHGSVKIDSIVIGSSDVTPPTTTVAPAVSSITNTTASFSATINENGTGYYLVLPAASAAPSVAAVQAGTSFAMTANVAATVSLTGLSASTAYKVWFVAKDAANNVQAAVASADLTTNATDTTPNTFDFTNLSNQALGAVVTTNTITVAGIDTAVTATTTVGTLVKNGTDTGLTSTTVVAGDTLAVKITTSGNSSTAVNGTVTIGTGATSADNFSVTTVTISAPTGVSISGAILSWNAVSGANLYETSWDDGVSGEEVAITTYSLLPGHDGKTLRVRSSANNGTTWSGYSSSVTYVIPVPATPTGSINGGNAYINSTNYTNIDASITSGSGGEVWVNGIDSGVLLSAGGTWTPNFDFSNHIYGVGVADGVKTFNVTIKKDGKTSNTLTLSFTKDTAVNASASTALTGVNESDYVNQTLTIASEPVKIITGDTQGGITIGTTSAYSTVLTVSGVASTGGSFTFDLLLQDSAGNQNWIETTLVVVPPI